MRTDPYPPIRHHLWVLENMVRDDHGRVVEYDERCVICGDVRHVKPEEPDECPGPPD